MGLNKYLFIYRNPGSTGAAPRSPEQLQQMLAAWGAWKAKFSSQILEMGDGLKPNGRVLSKGRVTDGPFIEGKDVVAGFSIIQAETYDKALAVAKECPMVQMPEAIIEIREMQGY